MTARSFHTGRAERVGIIRHGDGFVADPEGAPREPDEPGQPTLNPQYPVVEGDRALTDDWVLSPDSAGTDELPNRPGANVVVRRVLASGSDSGSYPVG